MRGWQYFIGTSAAIGLLLTAAGSAWMQNERATDGKTLAGESAATQALFRAAWGTDADRQWVTEHNAELTRLGLTMPPGMEEPPMVMPPVASAVVGEPPAMPTAVGTAAVTATAASGTHTPVATAGTAVATSGTAVATAGTAVANETPGASGTPGTPGTTGTPGAAGASGSPAGAPTVAPPPPTMVPGAQATANALPRVGVPPTPVPSNLGR
jgi:hypothetical protein